MDKRVGFPQHLTTRWDDFDRRSPYMRRQWPKEEPFEERRRRVHSVSPAYASSWAQFMSELIDADTGEATYYAYAFWTKAPWGESFDEIVFSLRRACELASCAIFPALKRISRKRIPPTSCAMAMVLPAQREDGVPHVHGTRLSDRCSDVSRRGADSIPRSNRGRGARAGLPSCALSVYRCIQKRDGQWRIVWSQGTGIA